MSAETGNQERPLEPHEVVAGRYELTQLLARGGMGEVFAARDLSTGQPLALKRLRPTVRAQRGIVVHFMREFHALSELRHPRIIEVYDYGVENGAPYYTMELLDGQDLRDLSPLPYREACLYLRDVASSLALLHARRLLHRDVSPRNVRRTSNGRCKLIDFGAMTPFGVPPNVTGTAPCIPPEALQGASLDQRTDLFSLGALAYFVLTGRHCYEAVQLDELPEVWSKPTVRLKERVREVPEALDDLVMSLVNLDPMKRPKSAAEVIDWLSAIGQLQPDDAAGVARSFLTSSRLCGRAAASEELTRRLQRGVQGRGSSVIISGHAGCGKTRMLAEASLIAQTCGLSAVRVSARRQRGTSYALAQDMTIALRQIAPLEAANAGLDRLVWPRSLSLIDEAAQLSAATREDAAEQRARTQESLSELFSRVAKSRPLLLAVDDLDRADEFSMAMLAGLARQAATLPLVIIVTEAAGQRDDQNDALSALHGTALTVQLPDLNRAESGELVQSMFGNVPNIDRLTDWMFRVARGNPKQTIELAEHLMNRGLVRYVDGTWVLPSDEIDDAVPQSMAEAWGERIRSLSAAGLTLAELLSVRRNGASAELCLAAGAAEAEHIFAALDELVREGVLESAGDEYVFPQDELRKAVLRRLSPERAGELHRRWAEVLLAETELNVDSQLEAGWHLIHTADELRGAELLAQIAPRLIEQGLAMNSAIPALEKALEVYERLGRSLSARLRMRSTLVLAGYLYDYRLARRYGQQTLELLHEHTGMRLASRMSPFLGPRLAFDLAILFVLLRRLWLPKERRGPPPWIALRYFVRGAMGLLGVRATGLDGPGSQAIVELLAPLRGAPWFSSGRVIYLAARAIGMQPFGRESEVNVAVHKALKMVARGRKRDMTEVEYKALLIGLLTCDGTTECYRERSEALKRADALDRIGSRLAQAASLRIRMIYYLRRGDSDRAEQCRRLIDLHAIQGGKTWQVEWFAVPVEGMAGATWTDLVMMRRSLERLDRMLDEVPSLAPLRDLLRISYCFRRGEFARAAELGEQFIAVHPPRSIVGWGSGYGITALALIEMGRGEDAKRICERGLAQLSEDDRAYFAMYSVLQIAYATAIAVLGERKRADQLLAAQFERLRSQGDQVNLVVLHQYQARLARLVGDRGALMQALQAMRNAALSSGFPAVILLADRVAELRAKHRSSPLPPPKGAELAEAPAVGAAEETAVTTFLRNLESGSVRNLQALNMLAGWVAADEAFLYARLGDGVQLVAALNQSEPPPQLTEQVRAALLGGEAAPSMTLEAEVSDPRTGQRRAQRFRVVFLPSERDAEGFIGAVVVREWDEQLEGLPDALIHDIGRVLAEDIRAERVTLVSQ
jgi:hypothetical protein